MVSPLDGTAEHDARGARGAAQARRVLLARRRRRPRRPGAGRRARGAAYGGERRQSGLVIHSTRSARADDQQWRALVPLDEPLAAPTTPTRQLAFLDPARGARHREGPLSPRVAHDLPAEPRRALRAPRQQRRRAADADRPSPIIRRREATRAADDLDPGSGAGRGAGAGRAAAPGERGRRSHR